MLCTVIRASYYLSNNRILSLSSLVNKCKPVSSLRFCSRTLPDLSKEPHMQVLSLINVMGILGLGTLVAIFEDKRKRNGFSCSTFLKIVCNSEAEHISPRKTFNFLADVVEKIEKSVVYIEILARHPFSKKYFPVTTGSGFIVRSDGLILTNAHVVPQYGSIKVKLHDGKEFYGVVESRDAETDLAVVRISAINLPALKFAKSSEIRPGEFVIAMGNPFYLNNTITAGVVSSASRHGTELGLSDSCDYIQTDAAINIGNSGGPLVNLDGEVIGVNTIKIGEGISFAIPSDRAAAFLKKSEEFCKSKALGKSIGKQKSKFLGLNVISLTSTVIRDLKNSSSHFPDVDCGILVCGVIADSPSDKSGIRAGDVIIEVNGKAVSRTSQLLDVLEKDDYLHLTFMRNHRKQFATVHVFIPEL